MIDREFINKLQRYDKFDKFNFKNFMELIDERTNDDNKFDTIYALRNFTSKKFKKNLFGDFLYQSFKLSKEAENINRDNINYEPKLALVFYESLRDNAVNNKTISEYSFQKLLKTHKLIADSTASNILVKTGIENIVMRDIANSNKKWIAYNAYTNEDGEMVNGINFHHERLGNSPYKVFIPTILNNLDYPLRALSYTKFLKDANEKTPGFKDDIINALSRLKNTCGLFLCNDIETRIGEIRELV